MLDDSEIIIDDDLDAINDETFGDDCGEYAWGGSQDIFNSSSNQVNGTSEMKMGKPQTEGYERYLEDVEAEDLDDLEDPSFMAVEESISRLVLDDDMDDAFPTPTHHNRRHMEATHSSLMPPQVANKHLDWFKNDLGDPLFQSSVWSMHPTETLTAPTSSSNRKPGPVSGVREPLPPMPLPSGPESSGIDISQFVKPQGMTTPPHRPPPGLGKGASPFRYLEDVEQELLASSSPTSAFPEGANKFQDDRISLKQEMFSPVTRNNQSPLVPPHTPPSLPPIHPSQQQDFLAKVYQHQHQQRQMLASAAALGIRPPLPGGQGYGLPNPNLMYHPRFAQTHGFPPGVIPIQSNHHAFLSMQQHQLRLQQMHQHQQLNHHQYSPGTLSNLNNHRGMPLPNSPRGVGYDPNTQHQAQRRRQTGGDPFAGLMTDRDKQRMKNIQMVQLQNDHPFTTDYYYQMKEYHLTRSTKPLTKLFPGEIESSIKNNYEPTRFENALGKLQAVSALAPKRIIDTYIQVHSTTVHGRNHRTRFLLEIEAVYSLFLDVKEVQYRKAAGTWSNRDVMERNDLKVYLALINKLDKYESRLPEWLSIRKGRILVFNLINCFQELPNVRTVAYRIFANVLKYMKSSDMKRLSDGDQDSKAYSFVIQDLISEATFQELNMLLESCNPNIWESRFGSTVFFALLERAWNKNIRDIAPEFWNGNWTDTQSKEGIPIEGYQKIPELLNELVSTPTNKITPPLIPPEEACILEFAIRFGVAGDGAKIKNILSYFSANFTSTMRKSSGAYDDIPY